MGARGRSKLWQRAVRPTSFRGWVGLPPGRSSFVSRARRGAPGRIPVKICARTCNRRRDCATARRRDNQLHSRHHARLVAACHIAAMSRGKVVLERFKSVRQVRWNPAGGHRRVLSGRAPGAISHRWARCACGCVCTRERACVCRRHARSRAPVRAWVFTCQREDARARTSIAPTPRLRGPLITPTPPLCGTGLARC